MFAFTSALDFYTDFMDILWNIFVLPAPFCYMALFITTSACTFSKKKSGNHKEHPREKKFTMWSCASNYPINGIWPTD
jgi:hypothetical protein